MRIVHVWDAEYPWDVRAEKVSQTLTGAGHEVHMVSRNRDRRPVVEELEEATVHRLAPLHGVGRRIDEISQFPAFFNPRWVGLIERVALAESADLVLVRDVPLAPTAVYVGRRLGLPVVLDMAENYPAMIRAIWEHGRQKAVDWLVRNPRAVAAVERWVIRRVDHVVVVVEESAQRLETLGVQRDHITIVRNTPPPVRRVAVDGGPVAGSRDGPLTLTYLGLMEAPRGIEVVLDAVALCHSGGVDVHLDLIGDGRDVELFVERAVRLGLDGDAVTFHGYRPYDEALEIVGRSDIGLVPHIANESWNTTIPNKLFDYMAAGLPVITSDARPAARIVRTTGCGAVYRSMEPASLAEAVVMLVDQETRRRCGEAGRRAVRDEYNWQRDGRRLVEAVERVGAGR